MDYNERQNAIWNTLCGMSGEEVAQAFTNWLGMQVLDEGFAQHLCDEGYATESEYGLNDDDEDDDDDDEEFDLQWAEEWFEGEEHDFVMAEKLDLDLRAEFDIPEDEDWEYWDDLTEEQQEAVADFIEDSWNELSDDEKIRIYKQFDDIPCIGVSE